MKQEDVAHPRGPSALSGAWSLLLIAVPVGSLFALIVLFRWWDGIEFVEWTLLAVIFALIASGVRGGVEEGVRAERGRAGRCPDCGYDLRGSPGRCPECGAERESSPDNAPS